VVIVAITAVSGSLVAFVVALLVGGLAIYLSARFVAGVDNYRYAVVSALLGAIGWALSVWVPAFGPLLALFVWIAVIHWRYPGGWVQAAIIGVGAWIAALLILFVLQSALGVGIDVVGVPGV
jgi:hypothetical protein